MAFEQNGSYPAKLQREKSGEEDEQARFILRIHELLAPGSWLESERCFAIGYRVVAMPES